MKSFTRVLILLVLFSCSSHSERNNDGPNLEKNENELVLKANLKACYSNYSNPGDRNYYYLVETKLINNSNVSGNYKCEISVNRNASVSASLITDFQRKKLKNVIFKDSFSVFQPV